MTYVNEFLVAVRFVLELYIFVKLWFYLAPGLAPGSNTGL